MTTTNESVRQAANRGDLNSLASILQALNFGDVLRALPVYLRNQVPLIETANPYQVATLDSIALPEDAKAAFILRATSIAGSTTGELTVEAYGTTPSTTQVAVAPNGDIVFNHSTDLITSVDVLYIPQKGDVLGAGLANSNQGNTSLSLPAPLGIVALPTSISGKACLLMAANATTATNTGAKIILVPASGVTATTKAALSIDKTKVYFNYATDVVTYATVDLLVNSGAGPSGPNAGADVNALLEAVSTYT